MCRGHRNVIEIEMEKGSGGSVSFVTNCFRLLQSVEMPSSGSDLTAFLIGSPPGGGKIGETIEDRLCIDV